MSDLNLDAIQIREMKATEGPWHRKSLNEIKAADGEIIVHWMGFDGVDGTKEQIAANARFIAHSRQDVPALFAEIERLKVKVERLTWKDAGTIHADPRRCRHCLQLEPNGHVYDCIARRGG